MHKLTRSIVLIVALLAAAPAFAQSAAQDLSTARAKYGPLVTRAEIGAILNEVAWKHRGEGLGLLGKSGGNNCPQPRTGRPVSCDWIVNSQTHRGGDVLRAATNDDGTPAPGEPTFNQNDAYDGANFVEPVEPEGATPPPPPPPPQPDTDTIVAIREEIRALDARISKLEEIGGDHPTGADAVAMEQLATSKAILELLKKTAARFGVQ